MKQFVLLLLLLFISSCSSTIDGGEDLANAEVVDAEGFAVQVNEGSDSLNTPLVDDNTANVINSETPSVNATTNAVKWWNPFTWGNKGQANQDMQVSANGQPPIDGQQPVTDQALMESSMLGSQEQTNKPAVLTKEEKELARNQAIDKSSKFKANIVTDYYGLPMLILRMPDNWKSIYKGEDSPFMKKKASSVDAIYSNNAVANNASFTENATQQPMAELKNTKDIERAKKNTEEAMRHLTSSPAYKDIYVRDISLSTQHEGLLNELIAKTKSNKNTLVIMFVHSTHITAWNSAAYNMEKSIYTQYVVSHLYRNIKNIKVEKRFIEDIPSDEIFIVVVNYEGNLDYNVYNAPKSSIAQWMARYRSLEIERIRQETESKKQIEALISGATALAPEVSENAQNAPAANEATGNQAAARPQATNQAAAPAAANAATGNQAAARPQATNQAAAPAANAATGNQAAARPQATNQAAAPAANAATGNQAAARPQAGNQAAARPQAGNQAAARPQAGNQATARPQAGTQAAAPAANAGTGNQAATRPQATNQAAAPAAANAGTGNQAAARPQATNQAAAPATANAATGNQAAARPQAGTQAAAPAAANAGIGNQAAARSQATNQAAAPAANAATGNQAATRPQAGTQAAAPAAANAGTGNQAAARPQAGNQTATPAANATTNQATAAGN